MRGKVVSVIVPWVLFGAAIAGIAAYVRWGAGKHRNAQSGQGRENPRRAA